ncbi:TauD/TfdA family dioxygenase [Streptomyces tagetis]|uniref:TauD/TfdA family dioxygenase n=1 Tax=Streptomyces tagetis TaxID=2820809 RepID=A0A941AZB0_9ACTN|nr:TauD/TfdA family dioxygenase [Streptomyces sp. RG38]MBQ0825161.1 TauD/TfdA family dioxygenase [Streptomyces sp. RG38]
MRPFDSARIDLDADLVHALAAEPGGETALPAGFAADLAAAVDRHVRKGPGFLVLAGFERLAEQEDRLRRAFLAASRLFGELSPQNGRGELLREVRDRGTRIGEGRTARYSDSRFGGSLHTDGAEAPLPVPEYFALLCVRQAARGGALQVIHVRDLTERLARRPGVLDTLRGPFHFDRRGDESPGEGPTTPKPVLFDDGEGGLGVTYLRQYIEAGHAHPGVPGLTAAQSAALDALDELLADPSLITEDVQRPGELVLFDNHRLLHGRTEFTDHTDADRSRLLFRTWIRRAA